MTMLENMVGKAVASLIDIEIYGWPPVCIGMIYQPERPQRVAKKHGRSENDGILTEEM
jgi:hypothetical protein